MTPDAASPQAVLDFWFGPAPFASRREWFVKDPAFDDEIHQRFGGLVEQALAGTLAWPGESRAVLAEILLLDQFTRNLFRGQARAFAGDARALALALGLIDGPGYAALHAVERWFALMPLEHAEDPALQERCVRLFEGLAADDPRLADALDYARRHQQVIVRFGRFPHRNAALGRPSTPDELAYLAQPGSGF